MRIVMVGPPGAGKGTQATQIKKKYGIVHLSTGEILRDEIQAETALGIQARAFMDHGHLVPDKILLEMMEHRLAQADCANGYLLDGFPRTNHQAIGFEKILAHLGHKLDAVISLHADEKELMQRLILRGKVSGRKDDTLSVIKKRQKIYWKQTAPLLDYYQQRNLLKEVDGIGEIPEVTHRILEALNNEC